MIDARFLQTKSLWRSYIIRDNEQQSKKTGDR